MINYLVCSPYHSFEKTKVFLTCHQLKDDKKNCDSLLSSDAIINAPIIFYELLGILINVSVAHDHVPTSKHSGIVIPHLKSGNSTKSFLSS